MALTAGDALFTVVSADEPATMRRMTRPAWEFRSGKGIGGSVLP